MTKETKWFSARCIFSHENDGRHLYEERIVLIEAQNLDEAIQKAEDEAFAYSKTEGCQFSGYVDVYRLGAPLILNGSEVYSMLRESELKMDAYLDAFFDTGNERCQQVARKYPGEVLMDIVYGVVPMEERIAHQIHQLLTAEEDIDFISLAHRLTYSHLDKAEAYQLGRALAEKAKQVIDAERGRERGQS